MTKQIGDIIDRIQGAAAGLRGVRAQLTKPQEPGLAPVEVLSAPRAGGETTPTQEQWDHAKKVITELKNQVEALEAEVSRESKEPDFTSGEVKRTTTTSAKVER